MKKALITGITGQDGSYLAELLLSKNYEVTGFLRRNSNNSLGRINHLLENNSLKLVEGEISDSGSVYSIIEEGQFDEVYNLAAQSHVGTSFAQPSYTLQVNALGPSYMLEAIKRFSPHTKFYQASTSELFGKNFTINHNARLTDKVGENGKGLYTYDRYQDEKTAFMPQSPYAVSKLDAHHTVRIYREGYGIHASCGILFNHESERRGENFVTRKITKWVGCYHNWLRKHRWSVAPNPQAKKDLPEDMIGRIDNEKVILFPKLRLGNIDAYRDWGHAQDYVEAMYLMVQQETPDDFVISTGKTYSVRDFLKEAFNEIGIEDFEPYIFIDPEFYRPSEVEYLRGCSDKAEEVLGWTPKVSFPELVKRMVWSDINEAKTQEEECIKKTLS